VGTSRKQLTDQASNEQMQRLAADLFEVAGAMRRDGEAIARTVGQTQARWQVMWTAAHRERSVPAIARRLGITRQSVQPVADELVNSGLARYAPNPDHRRSPLLVLTEQGTKIVDALNETAARRNLQVSRELGDARVGELRALLDLLRRALEIPHS
jgi:DNA-binding MarR family transcriptional regulator